MSDPECDKRRHRESALEERAAKRVKSNVLDGEKSDAWVEVEERMGANPPSSPTRSVSLPTTHRADLWRKMEDH